MINFWPGPMLLIQQGSCVSRCFQNKLPTVCSLRKKIGKTLSLTRRPGTIDVSSRTHGQLRRSFRQNSPSTCQKQNFQNHQLSGGPTYSFCSFGACSTYSGGLKQACSCSLMFFSFQIRISGREHASRANASYLRIL